MKAPAAVLLLIAAACGAPAPTRAGGEIGRAVASSVAGGREQFTHLEWDRLLARGTRDGLVDYDFMRQNRPMLDAYLDRVAAAPLALLLPAHLEALLINAYNALTVLSILEHPGAGSIKEIPGVWSRRRHRVGGFDLTLDDIEHKVLRPYFRDPRLHFALNCASRSCAPLPPWAFDGARLEEQLEQRARAFLADPRQVRVEGGRLLLSRYFDWYGEDFGTKGTPGGAVAIAVYVKRYAAPGVVEFIERHGGAPPIAFLDYDWSLNAVATRTSSAQAFSTDDWLRASFSRP